MTYDLLSPEVREDPYPLFAALRQEAAICPLAPFGFWGVSRYEDVRFILDNPQLFAPRAGAPYLTTSGAEGGARTRYLESSLLVPEAAPGSAARAVLDGALTPEALAPFRTALLRVANALVDRVLEREGMDLASDFLMPLPVWCMSALLDIGPARRSEFVRASLEVQSDGAPVDPLSDARMGRIQKHINNLTGFLSALAEQRQESPGDDLLSRLLAAEVDGQRLSPREAAEAVLHLVITGDELIANLVGNVLMVMASVPGVYARLRESPDLIPAMVEETLRYSSPQLGLLRVVVEDTVVGTTFLPAGASVLALVASAHRDPAHFPDPDRFDLSRNPADHLAFGAPEQPSLVSGLARVEAQIAVEVLLERLPDLARGEEPTVWCGSLLNRGPRWVSMRFADPVSEG